MTPRDAASGTVRQWGLRYRAHNGLPRPAVLLLPAEYGPENPPPPLRLVQETLLGQHPHLLAGAVAFDSVTNFYTRYRDFARIRNGRQLQMLARMEVGGTPASNPRAYVLRSPIHWVEAVARSDVPLQLWWSDADEIVVGQKNQSGSFYDELRKLRPSGRVEPVTGSWSHTAETYSNLQLPAATKWLDLIVS